MEAMDVYGHNYIGHNYIGHHYAGHNCMATIYPSKKKEYGAIIVYPSKVLSVLQWGGNIVMALTVCGLSSYSMYSTYSVYSTYSGYNHYSPYGPMGTDMPIDMCTDILMDTCL